METLDMALLYDYYGELLTERQRMCFELRHNQDFSLSEIAEELHVSRQGIYDNLNRAESLLLNMEEKTGCVRRDLACRRAAQRISDAVQELKRYPDRHVSRLADQIDADAMFLKE